VREKTELKIVKHRGEFVVDDFSRSGSPGTGRGKTIMEAIGNFFHVNQANLNISFIVDDSAMPAERRRRARELSKR
jgi:hypothetical protein